MQWQSRPPATPAARPAISIIDFIILSSLLQSSLALLLVLVRSTMSSRNREVEHTSASQCEYEAQTAYVSKSTSDGSWHEPPDPPTDATDAATMSVPVVVLRDGTTVRVAPMERKCGGWDEEHFHDKLRLPEGSNAGRGMVVTLEAMARECVAIALSPTPYFDMGKTYVVHFGASGNLSTVFRRRLPNVNEAIDASFPSRVCTDDRYQSYWIILQGGKLSAGVGPIPGKRCVGTLDDSLYNQLRSGVDAVRCVGIGNSALGRHSRDLRVRNVRVMPIPSAFGGIDGIPIEEEGRGGGGFVNVMLEPSMGSPAASVPNEAELLAEYEKECAKAKARAAKFGTEYKQPPPDAFFKWSEARRLRANPERGFATGFDVMSPDERAKAQRRKERFAEEDKKRRREMGEEVEEGEEADGGDGNPQDDENAAEEAQAEADAVAAAARGPLPVEQAWDNEDLVGEHRLDPPEELYASEAREDTDEQNRDKMEGEEGEEKAVAVPEKIHIFGIDWAAFKQIRSDDIMAYFKMYGPSYVEWLGELSCNVLFEDKFSAARALAALSSELPSPPPESIGVADAPPAAPPVAGVALDGSSSSAAAAAAAAAPADPAAPDDAAMGDDGETGGNAATNIESEPSDAAVVSRSDLGRMGWRLCTFPIRKVVNDRFGRRGTRSRVLMRVASSFDVLVERPTEWPRPPPGFTTKRILGPGSDFKTEHRRTGRKAKRRRRSGGRDGGGRRRRSDGGRYSDDGYGDRYDEYDMEGGQPRGLEGALSSGRAGFSVEEMEAEREARKKTADAGGDDEAMD